MVVFLSSFFPWCLNDLKAICLVGLVERLEELEAVRVAGSCLGVGVGNRKHTVVEVDLLLQIPVTLTLRQVPCDWSAGTGGTTLLPGLMKSSPAVPLHLE